MGVHYVRGTENGSPYDAGLIFCTRCSIWFHEKLAWRGNRCPSCHQLARLSRRNRPKKRGERVE